MSSFYTLGKKIGALKAKAKKAVQSVKSTANTEVPVPRVKKLTGSIRNAIVELKMGLVSGEYDEKYDHHKYQLFPF